mgnify:CR=1 FL=1
MRTSNAYLYQAIITSLPSALAEQLRGIVSEVTIEGDRRKIIKVGESKPQPERMIYQPTRPGKRQLQPGDPEELDLEEEEEDEFDQQRKGNLKKRRKEEHSIV